MTTDAKKKAVSPSPTGGYSGMTIEQLATVPTVSLPACPMVRVRISMRALMLRLIR